MTKKQSKELAKDEQHKFEPRRLPKRTNAKARYRLKAWIFLHCVWMHELPIHPTIPEQLTEANRLANLPNKAGKRPDPPIRITEKIWRRMRSRSDYQDVVRALEEGGLEEARVKLHERTGHLVDLHMLGADKSWETGDTRGLVRYTSPVVDSLLPRRVEHQHAVDHNIVISISEGRMARSEMPAIPIQVEELPPENLLDDEDGDDEAPRLPRGFRPPHF